MVGTDALKMKCREAEDLLDAYGSSAEAYGLAAHALLRVLSGSQAEFWSALKIAESAKDDCNKALEAIDLHIVKHHCQPNSWRPKST
jgi:hypothetical protein